MASDVQRWFDSEARQTEAIARAERDALAAEVSALRAALEAAETDAQLCRERLGDERERRRAAEALAVPDGWKVEWTAGSPWWKGKPRLVPADTEQP